MCNYIFETYHADGSKAKEVPAKTVNNLTYSGKKFNKAKAEYEAAINALIMSKPGLKGYQVIAERVK